MPNHVAPLTAPEPSSAFLRLLNVLNTLRTECPWDKKQTMETLRHLTIEETYELSDAILEGNLEEIKKVYKPEDKHYIGIYQIKTDCEGKKTLNLY